jgi:branched-chain amino acid transport system ATP-binding protein
MKEILRVENLSKSFGKFKAVDNVSFSLRELEITALIGPNGAGKTTLVNLVTKKLKPDQGRILFMGRDITNLNSYQITRLGIVRTFQIVNLFPTLTVYENLKVAALGSKTDNKEIEMIMSELRLDKYKDVKVMNVSFGVQKLVELAMALLLKPKLLILDEPAAGLPREDRKNLMRILKEIGEKITLLVIEHDMEFVFELAQRIMVMNRGKIIADGKPDDIINNSIVREIYLGES